MNLTLSRLALSFLVFFQTGNLLAQTEGNHGIFPCGSSEAIEKSLNENPSLRNLWEDLERFTKSFTDGNQNKALDSTYTIPVVFHVFHTYGAERISEAQIRDCIRILNEDFQNLNPDSGSVTSNFKNLVGRPQIRFRLAGKDPVGRCTKGINYIESPLHTQGGENLKQIVSWDTKRYLNIWVCSNVESGAAAYAYYPGTAPAQSREGIVSRSDYVGSIGTSNSGYAKRTLTHEVGHYFNLPHTWGNSNTPGAASNCNMDDGVSDTPNCIGVSNSGCNLSMSSCNNLNNVENHMEYSSCRRMFTKGQVLRMHAAVNSSTAFRNNLWRGTNLVFTGTTNDSNGDECPAKADFKINLSRLCAGQPVTFTQLAYNVNNPAALAYSWSFPGGTPSSSILPNPVVSYEAPGLYSAKLVVTNAAGQDSLVRSNLIRVLPSEPSYQAGEIESFEEVAFPNFPGNANRNWDITSTIATTWRRSTNASVTGVASLFLSNNSASSGSVHTLISPVFEIAGPTSGARISLKYAFARRNANNNDKLVISYSTNCGRNWTQITNRTGSTLATTPDFVTISFFPDATDWRQLSLGLSGISANPQFRLRFEFTSDGGNNLYIDDLQLTTVTSVSNLQDDALGMFVVPNPSMELPVLVVDRAEGGKAEIEIVDVLGKVQILKKEIYLSAGRFELPLQKEIRKPEAGTYWVRLRLEDRVMIRQWVVLP